MLGYTVGVTLFLTILLVVISSILLLSGKSAGLWGKAAGVAAAVFVGAFLLWITVEQPAYYRQQAKIMYQKGQDYLAVQDYEMAYDSFKKITKADRNIYNQVQPMMRELAGPLAQAKLDQAKALYEEGQYSQALDALKISMQYETLDEAKTLLPVYQKAAGRK